MQHKHKQTLTTSTNTSKHQQQASKDNLCEGRFSAKLTL